MSMARDAGNKLIGILVLLGSLILVVVGGGLLVECDVTDWLFGSGSSSIVTLLLFWMGPVAVGVLLRNYKYVRSLASTDKR